MRLITTQRETEVIMDALDNWAGLQHDMTQEINDAADQEHRIATNLKRRIERNGMPWPTFIVTMHETVDGPRDAVIVLQAIDLADAQNQAISYFSDWNFSEYAEMRITELPESFDEPINIELSRLL